MRIADDVHTFSESVSLLWQGLINPLARMIWYAYRFSQFAHGNRQAMYLGGYLVVAAILVKRLMPDYKKMTADTSSLEGKYKKLHNNVRVASESIGFFGGGLREKKVVTKRFEGLIDMLIKRSRMDFFFGYSKGVLLHVIPDRIQASLLPVSCRHRHAEELRKRWCHRCGCSSRWPCSGTATSRCWRTMAKRSPTT